MSDVKQPTPARPRQVTLAAWLIMVGSVIVVAMVFDRVGALHTLETRKSVEKFLAEPPGSDLGVGVDGVLTLLRVVSMVAAGCATAAAILGYQVLRRSRSARLALTVVAVPLFLTGMVTGGFVSSVVAAAALMLWLQPSRDWFQDAGTTAAPRIGALAPRTSAPVDAPTPAAWVAPPAAPPGPSTAVPPTSRAGAAAARPPAVLTASVLTWVCSGLAAIGLVLTAVVLALDPDMLLDEAHKQRPDLAEQGVSDDMLLAVSFVMIGALVVWCIAAAVLAVLVLRRIDWARIVLVVSAAVAALVSLAGLVMGGVPLILMLVAAVGTVVLLVRPDVSAWFRGGTP
ncbi:hypothetical protein [Nocardioides sp. T2.26MG-1]|uniref:hypothetical protein n=1 Tax=Nocardioides sp. T2.26MG-1 TaxID=3041166 RepID=UPI002477598A|nr:hypothetical protein [Nocardioides sp. T2.26MG-1]CAI9412346.1 hypothetical protein HIDPHFAB_01748 [Nocardioides sp. T2.26MG-1]